MPDNPDLNLTPQDLVAISQAVFGEGAGADPEFQKMVTQTILNRIRSGRKKEFGANTQEVLYKGYNAVKNPNEPYKTITGGEPLDPSSKRAYGQIEGLVNAIVADKDYGNAMFYFTPEEEEGLKAKKAFNFNAVKPTGMVGKFRTYGY